MLGQALHEQRRYGAAAVAFGRVVEPDYRGLVNLGWNLHLTGRSEEAKAILLDGAQKALANDALPWTNYGQCCLRLGSRGGAIGGSEEALRRSDDPIHHVAYALALFAAGRWAEGFAEYDARLAYKIPQVLQFPYPRWGGERVGVLFLSAEFGLGDTIWMLRYVREAARRVERVVLYVQKELLGLVRGWLSDSLYIGVHAMPRAMPDADAWCPLMGLPAVLGVEPEGGAYLPANDVGVLRGGLRVGIAWASSPENEEAVWRDIPLAEWLPLLELQGIEFHSLQVGPRAQDIGVLGLHGLVWDRAVEISDFADTARIVGGLDLVICADSAVAHLAGAMGKWVWLLRNAKAAPWIWLIEGRRSVWYDSMRVLTRGRQESWADLILSVRDRLRAFSEWRGRDGGESVSSDRGDGSGSVELQLPAP
jgi:hypothetical protein